MYAQSYAPHVEISLDNLLWNLGQIRSLLSPGTDIIAVVKDNSYGCGSVAVSKVLEKHGNVFHFAVARPEEGFTLRENGIQGHILVLGRIGADLLDKCIENRLTPTLNDLDDLDLWNRSGLHIAFHCNIDTAMHRMGILPAEIPQLISTLRNHPSITCEGVFTHLAKADIPGTLSVSEQKSLFFASVNILQDNGIGPKQIHIANSAGLMRFPMSDTTLVRPGIALYGCKPDPSGDFPLDLRPVLSLKSVVAKIKKVPANTPVSYCGNYITKCETHIATIAAGYAHGLPRFLGNRGAVLINGRKYTIAGNVTMDYIMVDAGDMPEFSVGDEVVIIGRSGSLQITPDNIALIGNTIGYEILCNISTSIRREYFFQGSSVVNNGIIF
jgi:alanine racemase